MPTLLDAPKPAGAPAWKQTKGRTNSSGGSSGSSVAPVLVDCRHELSFLSDQIPHFLRRAPGAGYRSRVSWRSWRDIFLVGTIMGFECIPGAWARGHKLVIGGGVVVVVVVAEFGGRFRAAWMDVNGHFERWDRVWGENQAVGKMQVK